MATSRYEIDMKSLQALNLNEINFFQTNVIKSTILIYLPFNYCTYLLIKLIGNDHITKTMLQLSMNQIKQIEEYSHSTASNLKWDIPKLCSFFATMNTLSNANILSIPFDLNMIDESQPTIQNISSFMFDCYHIFHHYITSKLQCCEDEAVSVYNNLIFPRKLELKSNPTNLKQLLFDPYFANYKFSHLLHPNFNDIFIEYSEDCNQFKYQIYIADKHLDRFGDFGFSLFPSLKWTHLTFTLDSKSTSFHTSDIPNDTTECIILIGDQHFSLYLDHDHSSNLRKVSLRSHNHLSYVHIPNRSIGFKSNFQLERVPKHTNVVYKVDVKQVVHFDQTDMDFINKFLPEPHHLKKGNIERLYNEKCMKKSVILYNLLSIRLNKMTMSEDMKLGKFRNRYLMSLNGDCRGCQGFKRMNVFPNLDWKMNTKEIPKKWRYIALNVRYDELHWINFNGFNENLEYFALHMAELKGKSLRKLCCVQGVIDWNEIPDEICINLMNLQMPISAWKRLLPFLFDVNVINLASKEACIILPETLKFEHNMIEIMNPLFDANIFEDGTTGIKVFMR